MKKAGTISACCLVPAFLFIACKQKTTAIAGELADIHLKRGKLILCGPPERELGTVDFVISGDSSARNDFNLATALLHSFEYDEAEKVYARIIETKPDCAMAYWGVAMANFHPLWTPPEEPELVKGEKCLAIARSISSKTERETAYIDALSSFYRDWKTIDHRSRCLAYEKAMAKVYESYPQDREAGIFYALSLDAAADPSDLTFSNQKKAGEILKKLYPGGSNHPGVIHYIIHTYDYPGLADSGLEAARKYAKVAASSAHAQHMPSHIFTRLGLWDEAIQSNLASVESAKCYAETAGIDGHWDEELHGMDYLMYAYLQMNEQEEAKRELDYLGTIQKVYPSNMKVAYTFASLPSRFVLESRLWKQAASLQVHAPGVDWKKFPWQEGIIHFARGLGAVHTGNAIHAQKEIDTLASLQQALLAQKDSYKANQVAIQLKTLQAWRLLLGGKKVEAIEAMRTAADMEDKTQKHPVTPGEVLPARELLGDLFLEVQQPSLALQAYEANLEMRPNRRNSVSGAWAAAAASGNKSLAATYATQYRQLTGEAPKATREEYVKDIARRH